MQPSDADHSTNQDEFHASTALVVLSPPDVLEVEPESSHQKTSDLIAGPSSLIKLQSSPTPSSDEPTESNSTALEKYSVTSTNKETAIDPKGKGIDHGESNGHDISDDGCWELRDYLGNELVIFGETCLEGRHSGQLPTVSDEFRIGFGESQQQENITTEIDSQAVTFYG